MRKHVSIGVGGRFHAQEMAKALLGAGHDVKILTSFLPRHFPLIPQDRIQSNPLPEIAYRGLRYLGLETQGANFKIQSFGKFLAKSLSSNRPDVLISWSGFSKEAFQARVADLLILERNSSHISEQLEILKAAHADLGLPFTSQAFVENRELTEYSLADKIVVLSEASAQTFVKKGIPRKKIFVQHGGIDLSAFRPRESKRTAGPLRVIYFGAISVRKGIPFLLEAIQPFSDKELTLTLVGEVEPAMKSILPRYKSRQILPPMPHSKLAPFLRDFDVFAFPSLEDGFGYVVPQAMASGLVPIVSRSAGASELIRDGINGFLVAPRNPLQIREALTSLIDNFPLIGSVRQNLSLNLHDLSWERYTRNFVQWFNGVAEPAPVIHAVPGNNPPELQDQ